MFSRLLKKSKRVSKRRKRQLFSDERRSTRRKQRKLLSEHLESRTMLAVTPVLITNTADTVELNFRLGPFYSGDVYVRTDNAGTLEWSQDGTSYQQYTEATFAGKKNVRFSMSLDPGAEFASNFDADRFNALIVGNFSLPGTDVGFSALELQVLPNSTIDTSVSSGASGDLIFAAPRFSTGTGVQLVTDHAADTDTPGNLAITATANLDGFISFFSNSLPVIPSVSNMRANVSLVGTTIRAGGVTIDADADAADLYDDDQPGKDTNYSEKTVEAISEYIGSISLFFGFAISKASSSVTIDGGTINADNVSITSDAATDAITRSISPLYGALALGIAEPKAMISVTNGTGIVSTGDVSLSTNADADLVASSSLRGARIGASVTVGIVDLDSKATLSSDSSIRAGGKVDVIAHGNKNQSVNSTTSGYKEAKGTMAVTYSQSVTDVLAAVDGVVDAGSHVTIDSDLKTERNTFTAGTTTGLGSITPQIVRPVRNLQSWNKLQKSLNFLVGKQQSNVRNGGNGFAGGFNVGYQTNDVQSRVGNGASVTSVNGDLQVTSTLQEFPKLAARSYTASRNEVVGGRSVVDIRDSSVSIAVSIGQFDNEAMAIIGDNATINVGRDLNVRSSTEIPWEQLWTRRVSRRGLQSPGDFVGTKINYDFGIQNGFFTSWAEAFTEGREFAFGLQANILSLDNNAEATIGSNAQVTVGRDATVLAAVENDTLNFAGQFAIWNYFGSGADVASADGTGIGAAILTVVFNNDAIADVKSGASVDAESLLVMARSDSSNLSIVTQGGSAGGLSINGGVSAFVVDGNTIARIDDGATVTTRTGLIEIPRDFDVVNTEQVGIYSPINSFIPKQPIAQGDPTLRVDVNTEIIQLGYQHGFNSNDPVRYYAGAGSPIGGLTSNATYYVVKQGDSGLQLSATPGGAVIDLNLDNTSGNQHSLVPGFKKSAISLVDNKTIDLGRRHDLLDKQAVVYYGQPNAIGPLSEGSVYFIKRVDEQRVQLSLTEGGPAITLNAAQASETGHFLIPVTSTTKAEIAPTRGLQTFKLENPLASLDTDGDSDGDGQNDGVPDGKIDARDKHIRAVTDTEYWTNLSLLVLADDNSDAYSGVGGITWGHSVGVGGSVAVNTILRETNAIIGNLKIDLSSDTAFAPGVGVDSNRSVYLGYNHGFSTGDRVTYAGGGDLEISGLRDGETYYVNLGADSDSSGDPVFTLSRTANESSATFNQGNVDTTNHVIDLGYTHGFQLGDLVRYQSGGSAVIGGLEDGRDYIAIPVSATTIALAETSSDSIAEVQFVFDPAEVVQANQLVFPFDHGFATGEAIRYTAGGGTAISPLISGSTYYVHVVNDKTIELRATAASQVSIILGRVEGVGRSHTLQQGFIHSANSITGAVTGSSHTVDLGYWHGIQTGDPVRYSTPGNTITGLQNNRLYYAIVDGEQKIALANTNADAIKGQWQFFDAANAIKPSGNASRIELAFDNGYALGDALVYSRNAFYSGPGVDPTTAISYTDVDGNSGTLTEGMTLYAIPVFDPVVRDYDPVTKTFTPLHLGVRLALSSADAQAGRALTLSGSPVGIHSFHLGTSRIAIDATRADNSAQFFALEKRVELSAPASAGATHKIRLAADPTGTREETHGLGRVITPIASAGVSFDPATAVSGNTITKPSHGLVTGARLLYDDGATVASSATAIGGLYRGQIVYAIVTSPSTFRLAATPEAATVGNAITLDPSTAVGTNHQVRTSAIDHTSAVHLGYTHGLKAGDAVVYSNGSGTSIGGIGHGQVYYVIATSATSIQLAVTKNDAISGKVIALSPYPATGDTHGFGRTFRATPLVDGPTDRIQLQKSHPFQVGQQVVYSAGSGTAIGGLQNGASYYVVGTTRESLQLSETPGGAAIALDPTLASGTEHSIGTLATAGSIVSGGEGAVIANNQGEIVSITVAGTIVSKAPEVASDKLVVQKAKQVDPGNNLVVARKYSLSESSDSVFDGSDDTPQGPPAVDPSDLKPVDPPKRSIAVAGTAAVNVIRGRTRAVVSDSDLNLKSLDVLASDTSNSLLIAGSLAIATGSANSKGIAGAFVANAINNDTDARIERSKVIVTGGDVFVDADNDSRVITIAMGGSGASKTAVAGSVAVNVVGSEARARIVDQSEVTATADPGVAGSGRVSVGASDATVVTSVAGAGGFAIGTAARDRWGIGAAINLIFVTQKEGTLAIVEDSDVTADGVVSITAKNENRVTGVTVAIAAALGGVSTRTLAAAVSIGIVLVDTNVRASVRRKKNGGNGVNAKRGLRVEANDNSRFVTIAGGGALADGPGGFGGSGRAGGASILLNVFNQDANADITATPVKSTEGSVSVLANSAPTITAVAAGASVGADAAYQGSFAITVVRTDTSARITNAASRILADGNVVVTAEDRAKIVNVAGSIALSALFSGSNEKIGSVGLANGTVDKRSNVNAFIDDDILVQANGDRGFSLVPTSTIENKEFKKENQLGVAVAAVSNANIVNVAAGGAITGPSRSSAFAASATVTIIDDETKAWIGDRTQVNTDPTLVVAGANENIAQSVTVVGANRTKLDGVAGAAGVSFGNGGVGAGLDIAFIDKDTEARIESAANVQAEGNVIVDAYSNEKALSVSGSIGVGNGVGAAFGVGVSVFNLTNKAIVGSSATINAQGSVTVGADNEYSHEVISGSLGIGVKNIGGAGAIAVPIITKITTATVGDSAKIDAHAKRGGLSVPSGNFNAGGDVVDDGVLGSADLDYTHTAFQLDPTYFVNRKASPAMLNAFKGVSVTATSESALEVYSIGAGGSGKGGIAVSLGVSGILETTTASIGTSAEVNQNTPTPGSDQSVNVAAGNDAFGRFVVGALSFAGQVAASGSVGLVFFDMDTTAEIKNASKVNAAKDVNVRAYNEEDLVNVAVSLAGSAGVGGASGSVVSFDLNNTTTARIGDGGTVAAGGNVFVHAEDLTDVDIVAGGIGIGAAGGGLGGSLGISLMSKRTTASIGSSTVDALGNSAPAQIFNGRQTNGIPEVISIRGVGVSSFATEDTFLLSVAGAVGSSLGLAGSLNWQKYDSDTTAEIRDGARINQAANNASAANVMQDVYVVAMNGIASVSVAGALGFSAGFGVGGGVDVGTIDNSTIARMGGEVNARGDIRVAANATRTVRSTAAAGAAGVVGVAGGISRWTVGGDVGSTYSVGGETANPLSGYDSNGNQTGTANADAEQQLNNAKNADSGYSSAEARNSGDNSSFAGQGVSNALGQFGSFVGKLTTVHSSETRALILPSATITAGDQVEVEAIDKNDMKLNGGGVAVGKVGVGGGIALLDISTPVEASVGQNVTITAGGDLKVNVTSDESLRALALSGGGGLLAGAAAYARVANTGSRSASLRSGVTITDARTVDVTSKHTADFLATSGTGTIGVGAAGISGANVNSAAKVEAFTQDVTIGSDLSRVGNINISATSDINNNRNGRMAHAVGVSAGVISATGTDARATVNPEVAASIGANSNVYSSGAVNVIGMADQEAKAAALGVDVGVAAFGATFATATVDPNVQAVVGDRAVVVASSIDVQSLFNVNRSGVLSPSRTEARSNAGRGGVFVFSGSTATARSEGSSATTIGSGAFLQSTTTDVTIKSHTYNHTFSNGDGVVFAVLAIGNVNSKSVVDTLSQVTIGPATTIDSKNNLTIAALSNEYIDTDSFGGDRAIFPFSEADGVVEVSNNTNVSVSSNVNLDAFNVLKVIAEVDHWSDSSAKLDARGFSLVNNIDVDAKSTINTMVDVNLFAANLAGQDVDVISRVKRLRANVRGEARGPVGINGTVRANGTLSSTTKTDIELLGSTILGRNSIDVLSEHPLIDTFADTYSTSPTATGPLDTIASNTTSITSDILADSNASLTTKTLIVKANVPAARSIKEISSRKRKGDGRGTDSPDVPTEIISREIDFNAAIQVTDTGPVLVIDANGVATTKLGGIDFNDDGSVITVTPVINQGDSVTSVSFEIPNNVGTRTMKGSANVQREQSFSGVSIRNSSARDLKLQRIDVFHPAGQVRPLKTTGLTSDTLSFNSLNAAPGATVIDIQNAQGVIVTADIDNPFGSTTITANTGNIIRVGEDNEIESATLKLEAKGGNIGVSETNAGSRFESKSATAGGATDVTLIASGNIFHLHSQGSVDVTKVTATGDIDLFSVGDILEFDGDGNNAVDIDSSALFVGRKIKLDGRSIGLSNNPIEIDTSTASGALEAFANTGIYLEELSDSISVKNLSSTTGNIVFSVQEAAGSGQSFALTSDGQISADAGSVTLNLPDDASFPEGGRISVLKTLTIDIDTQVQAGDIGAALLFDAEIIGGSGATITTGPDADTLDIRQLDLATVISTGAGNDLVTLSSQANRLNEFRASTRIDTGADADQLVFDASGGTALGMIGSMTASPVNGYTMRLTRFESGAPIDFTGAEQIDLTLGAGGDQATVEVVDDTSVLNLFAGNGDDVIAVGSVNSGVDQILGRFNADGGEGTSDLLKLNDASNLATKVGSLSNRTVSGLGMGDVTEGVRYDLFESIVLELGTDVNNTGTGDYQLNISSLSTPTTINLGAGGDTVTVGPSLFGISQSLTVNGGGTMVSDRLTIASDTTTSLNVGVGEISGRELAGTIKYSELEDLRLELSNSPDRVTVENTGAPLTIQTRDGDDDVQIKTVSHVTAIDLGSDTDPDDVRIQNAGAAITVMGDRRAIDRVDVDLSLLAASMDATIEDSTLEDTYEITGATTGKVSVTGVTDLLLRLGEGNDTAVLDTAKHGATMGPDGDDGNSPSIPSTELVLDGGLGLDDFRVSSLDG
ncbi:MAG: hypothetical protein AAF802_08775, partial [Planctomycetota bacterium]